MKTTSLSRSPFSSMSLLYGAGIAFDMFKFIFFVLLGAEAIFLSDVVISDLLPKVLDHQSGFTSLLTLIVYTMPGVALIALPLAVLVGSYLVIMNRRQAIEFAVIAGAGLSTWTLINLTVLIGFAALIASNLFSGFIEPHARYLVNKTIHNIQHDAIREGRIAPGKFYQIGSYAVFASSGQFSDAAHNLFFHRQVDPTKDRIITADQSIRLYEPRISGVGLLLQDVAVYELEKKKSHTVTEKPSLSEEVCTNCTEGDGTGSLRVGLSNQMFVQFEEADLPTLKPRESKRLQWTNLELLQRGHGDRRAVSILAERLLRDILCFLAPLLGLLAAAVTTNKTYLLALPTAGGVVLGAQFLGSYGMKSLASIGLAGTVAILGLMTLVIVLAAAFVVLRYEHGFIRPLGARV